MAKNKIKILPNHLGIYIRVSTLQQANEGVSVNDQRESGIKKANELGWSYVIYDDSALSGSISYLERPGMRLLMSDINEGKLGGMFSVDIDRWSRDKNYEEPQIIISIFKQSGIKIFTPSGELNLGDPAIEFMSRIQGLTSSFYRIQIQSKIKRALLQSANEGKAGGGPMQPYGYSKKNKMLVINESEAEIVKLIFEKYLKGEGTFKIAEYLNINKIPTKRNNVKKGQMTLKKKAFKNIKGEIIPERKIVKEAIDFKWRDKTVLGILKNTIYKGDRKFNDVVVASPIIIEPAIFDEVQTVIEEKKNFRGTPYSNTKKGNRFLLKGLIRCSKCGGSFYGKKRLDLKDNAYCCLSQRYTSEFCGTRGISIDYLDKLIWDEIKKIDENVHQFYERYEGDDSFKKEINQLKEMEIQIGEYNTHLLTLNRRQVEGKITEDEYAPLRDEYLKELSQLKESKEYLEKKLNTYNQKASVLQMIKDLSNRINSSDQSFDEKQTIIRALVDNISISYGVALGTNYILPNGHTIIIKYKIDRLTEIMLSKEIEVGYKKNGHRIGIIKESLVLDQLHFSNTPVKGNMGGVIFDVIRE